MLILLGAIIKCLVSILTIGGTMGQLFFFTFGVTITMGGNPGAVNLGVTMGSTITVESSGWHSY